MGKYQRLHNPPSYSPHVPLTAPGSREYKLRSIRPPWNCTGLLLALGDLAVDFRVDLRAEQHSRRDVEVEEQHDHRRQRAVRRAVIRNPLQE